MSEITPKCVEDYLVDAAKRLLPPGYDVVKITPAPAGEDAARTEALKYLDNIFRAAARNRCAEDLPLPWRMAWEAIQGQAWGALKELGDERPWPPQPDPD
mgnify:CR=1 FL=1